MRIWIEPGRGSSSILSVAFFGISSVAVSSVAISSDSIVLRFASLPDSCAPNYNATSNPNYDLKIVKLKFALRESMKKLEMEPQWEHDQARGGGSKGSGGDQGHAWGGGGNKAMHGVEVKAISILMSLSCKKICCVWHFNADDLMNIMGRGPHP
jgi:hypothetical protein